MKLSKKLLIAIIFALLFASTTKMEDSRKFSIEVTMRADGSTTPVEYEENEPPIKKPKSIHIIKAI